MGAEAFRVVDGASGWILGLVGEVVILFVKWAGGLSHCGAPGGVYAHLPGDVYGHASWQCS